MEDNFTKIYGVIAELNPCHLGHQYLFHQAREAGADILVVALSGNYVQRGEMAILNKFARAEMAIAAGADLVLEIPTPWAMAPAEIFARGGVELLSMAQCSHLVFGSECGDLDTLYAIEQVLHAPETDTQIIRYLQSGVSYPHAREMALKDRLGGMSFCIRQPNNILGIEYLRAIHELHSSMEAMTVQRVGAEHDSFQMSEIPSAASLRKLLKNQESIEPFIPSNVFPIIERELRAGRIPVEMNERTILSALRRMDENQLQIYADSSEGLHHRFYRALKNNTTIEDVLMETKTKRYTFSRISRMMMAAYLEMPKAEGSVPYARVLAFNENGRYVIREMKKNNRPVLTKAADVHKLGDRAQRYFEQESRYTDMYVMGYPNLQESLPGSDWRYSPAKE